MNDNENLQQHQVAAVAVAAVPGSSSQHHRQPTKPSSAGTTALASPSPTPILSDNRTTLVKHIARCVLRQKLQKFRHLVLTKAINPAYLESLFPQLLELFEPQPVNYNGGVAQIKTWKISCYLEVMPGGVPCTNPHLELLKVFQPLLDTCNDLFLEWYRQQHACNNSNSGSGSGSGNGNKLSFWERRRQAVREAAPAPAAAAAAANAKELPKNGSGIEKEGQDSVPTESLPSSSLPVEPNKAAAATTKTKTTCRRLMTFVTRYTPAPDEQALLKHVDGAGKVDGSVVVALPVDRWSAPYETNSFEGHGGGLTFWDGRRRRRRREVRVLADVEQQQKEEEEEEASPTKAKKNAAAATTTTTTTTTTTIRPREVHYETRSGDLAFIDRAVWHQADPITKGTRWALVIFYKVEEEQEEESVEAEVERKRQEKGKEGTIEDKVVEGKERME